MSDILRVRGLEAWYGLTRALHGVDFTVAEGGVTAILGANGAGKTTTLRAVCGMVKTHGEIILDGQPIQGRPTEQIVRLGVGHVVEGRGTFNDLTVEENLFLGAYTRLRDRRQVQEDFERVFGYFPVLRERCRDPAGNLSGGQQQMLAISRALMLRPRLLLLDEPSFGLAPLTRQEIYRILRTINTEQGMSLLLVEQNARTALDLADTACLLETGNVVLSGDTASIRDDEVVKRAYLSG